VRDLKTGVRRVAILLGNEPAAIPLNMEAISAALAKVSPVAHGMTPKRLANVRSDFLAAVKASGLVPAKPLSKSPLSAAWTGLFEQLSGLRPVIGLSRLARYASARGIAPRDIDDEMIEEFIAAVRAESLCERPTVLHRRIAVIWNEAARDSALSLQRVTVPSFRAAKRIEWGLLPEPFRRDVDDYLSWCAVSDPFAADARPRALAPRTRRLRRDQIHAAITALVECGTKPSAILSLADLVSPSHFKTILRNRLDNARGGENIFNHDLAQALTQIAREWVKVDAEDLVELKRLKSKMPRAAPGLTSKNRRDLRQFDDPAVLRRLYRLPERLFAEARDGKPNRRTLAKAQAALAIAILSYAPLRPQNLTALAFDAHLFLRKGAGAISTLEVPAHEVKNRRELAYDIPPGLAKMLLEYRDRIASRTVGCRPTRLFVNTDGKPKNQASVAGLVISYLRKRAGIVLTPHQFRHLSAKVVLDQNAGEYETIRQCLGHTSLKTTVAAYAGIDCRSAARRHQHLIEQALGDQIPARRRRHEQE
jgi:integrase